MRIKFFRRDARGPELEWCMLIIYLQNHMWQLNSKTKEIVNEAEVASKPVSTPLKVQAIYQFQIMLLPQKQILEMSPLHLFIPQVRNDSYSIKQIRKECLSL